jgi:acetyl esterase/lipase
MLEMGVKLSGYKKIYASDAEALIARTQKINSGRSYAPPKRFYRRFIVTETMVQGRPCFIIAPGQNVNTDRAVFFLYGGGFMLGIDFFHWNTVERILTELSVPICVPMYPIYPETDPNIIISFINESFTRFCEAYPEARIIGLGDSSGAYLLLSFCHYLTATNAFRFPDQLICVSPAQVVGIDEVVLNEMKAIDKKDVTISITILENLPFIFNLNGDDLNWFSAPLYGDFSRFPPIAVFSGTHDIFYPLMEPFVKRVRLQGKPIELYSGLGMMHVWPYMPIASESKHALNIIFEIIRSASYNSHRGAQGTEIGLCPAPLIRISPYSPTAARGNMAKVLKSMPKPACSTMKPPRMLPIRAGRPEPRDRYRDIPRARRSGGM